MIIIFYHINDRTFILSNKAIRAILLPFQNIQNGTLCFHFYWQFRVQPVVLLFFFFLDNGMETFVREADSHLAGLSFITAQLILSSYVVI